MASPSSNDEVTSGLLRPNETWGEFNNIAFVIRQAMLKMQTSMPVRVVKCTNSGGVSPVGFVDVVPLINQVTAQNEATPHTTIFNLPYSRLQGGSNAVIIDPQEGDIGIACFASRDISRLKATRKAANPGSARTFSFADGMYVGGMLNAAPTQYIQFSGAGIKIYSPTNTTVEAPTVNVVASASASVTAPVINLGAAGQTLLAFVTSAFQSLFNGHTHPVSGGTAQAPNQQIGPSHLTSTVKGG